MLAESRATAICRLAVGTIDRSRETAGISTIVASGRHAVAAPAGSATMPPAMAIVTMTSTMVIRSAMVATVTTPSVVTTQQHIK